MGKIQKMFKIKLVSRASNDEYILPFKNQSPDNSGIWDNCQFSFDPQDRDYDWLAIIDDTPNALENRTEILACPPENTIFITTEPSTITKYGDSFTSQFNYVITNQNEKSLPHKHAYRSQTGNVWLYGKDYNEIVNQTEPHKIKKLSTVCSNKRQGHTVHKQRYDFTAIMEKKIPELERFGRGFKWIETKIEAIDDYEFHVAIENQYSPDVWTEKLADTFLGYSVPIYYGCPNISEYFPKDSYILIDIYNEEESIKKIKKIISTPGEYERRLPAVREARRKVIEEYNLLAMISKIVNEHSDAPKSKISSENKIYNRRVMRTKTISDAYTFLLWKLKNTILNMKFW